MKVLTVFLFLVSQCALAQRVEIGAMLGAYTYKGEFNRYPNPLQSRPGGGVFLRQNISHTSALRYALNLGNIHGTDAPSKQPMNQTRNQSFSNTILEGLFMYEYNFFNFRESTKTFKRSSMWSPYLCGGIGGFVTNSIGANGSNGGVCIPFGMGLKYQVNKNWNFGADILARKTFTDGIDGQNTSDNTKIQTTFTTDKDWYYSACMTLSYTFYKVNCPDTSW